MCCAHFALSLWLINNTVTMKQKTIFILVGLWLCLVGTVQAQGPVKPKLCSTCGKMVVNCPYKGNHPKCATCGKLKESCPYKGSHPRCDVCGKTTDRCEYKGSHPKCEICGKVKEQCEFKGEHPKCIVCGKTKEECEYQGDHPTCDICGKFLDRCEYKGNHPTCEICGKLQEDCKFKGQHPSKETINVKGVSFDMILVEGGTFWMGAQKTNYKGKNYYPNISDSQLPVHEETVGSFYIGETEVTQALWQAVMGSLPRNLLSNKKDRGPQCPVCHVTWEECQTFIDKLNTLTGRKFRLPTEEEWEFAARGGKKSRGYQLSGSNKRDEVGWNYGNSKRKVHDVKTKAPNELGLYDMSGNVKECTSSYWREDYNAPEESSKRVIRGRSYKDSDMNVSERDYQTIGHSIDILIQDQGLRLVLDPQ